MWGEKSFQNRKEEEELTKDKKNSEIGTTQQQKKAPAVMQVPWFPIGVPKGIWTPVDGVKGRCPGPARRWGRDKVYLRERRAVVK